MSARSTHSDMDGSGGSGGGRPYLRPSPYTGHGMNLSHVMYNQGMIQQQHHPPPLQQQAQRNMGMGAYLHQQQQQQHSVVAAAYAPYQQQYSNSANSSMNSGHMAAPASGVGVGSGLLGGGSSGSGTALSSTPTAAQMLQSGIQNVNVSNNFVEIGESSSTGIRDVWSFNMREEFRTIRSLARNGFNYIAIDTEFPGAPVRPVGTFRSTTDYMFQILRVNCDCLRIIQIGFTLLDANGGLPPGISTWQFNFKFSLTDDMYASDSIELLQGSGIQFHRMEADGIDPVTFSEYLYSSGLVLNDDIRWISFHSGYDFGYMYRILMDRRIPSEENEFFTVLKMFFPFVYDIKYLMKSCKTLKGGLQELADELQVKRLGPSHQAGSDSLLTGLVFFKLREMYFEDIIDDDKYNGRLYGLAGTYYADDFDPIIPMIPLRAPDSALHTTTSGAPIYPMPPVPGTSQPEPRPEEPDKENRAMANTVSTLAVLSSAMANASSKANNK